MPETLRIPTRLSQLLRQGPFSNEVRRRTGEWIQVHLAPNPSLARGGVSGFCTSGFGFGVLFEVESLGVARAGGQGQLHLPTDLKTLVQGFRLCPFQVVGPTRWLFPDGLLLVCRRRLLIAVVCLELCALLV